MDDKAEEVPSAELRQDNVDGKAPDPRRHYDSPESLAEDVALDLPTRETLLQEWKYGLEQRLGAESEGMGANAPADTEEDAGLSAELRRVSRAHEAVADKVKRAGGGHPATAG